MNPHIINPNKYKKITRTNKIKKDKKSFKNIKSNNYKSSVTNHSRKKVNKIKRVSKKTKVKIKKQDKRFIKFFKVVASILLIVLIGYISKYITNSENNSILSVFNNNESDIKLEANYDFNIGITNLDNENNILINELYKYSYRTLVTFDEEYNIKYNIAKKINKLNINTYEIEIEDSSDIADVVYTIEKIKKDTNSKYYNCFSNISSVDDEDDKIVIKLVNPDPYIIYSFDFKIEKENDKTEEYNTNRYNFSNELDNISFIRNDSVNKKTLKSLSFKNYLDSDNMVSDFRENILDMFLTSSEEDMRLIGRHEYSIKKYRDGETYFLLGNKNSKLFSLQEVRKAITYSLNRNEIIREISASFAEIIDIPYIYSDIEYKYDIYGAENALIAQSWDKIGGIYNKKIDSESIFLELKLLVNVEDSIKVNIAENIKEMLESVGIKIDVYKLNSDEITEKIEEGEFDLVLTTIYIDDNPDISFMEEYININESINEAIIKVNNSSVDELSINIKNLQSVISNEIACIGIASKNTNVVYQKYITGFNNISYMNIFKNIDNLGKIVQ